MLESFQDLRPLHFLACFLTTTTFPEKAIAKPGIKKKNVPGLRHPWFVESLPIFSAEMLFFSSSFCSIPP